MRSDGFGAAADAINRDGGEAYLLIDIVGEVAELKLAEKVLVYDGHGGDGAGSFCPRHRFVEQRDRELLVRRHEAVVEERDRDDARRGVTVIPVEEPDGIAVVDASE